MEKEGASLKHAECKIQQSKIKRSYLLICNTAEKTFKETKGQPL